MKIYEKIGDFLFQSALMVLGGVIIGSIMKEAVSPSVKLYVVTICAVILLFLSSIGFYFISYNKKEKRKE